MNKAREAVLARLRQAPGGEPAQATPLPAPCEASWEEFAARVRAMKGEFHFAATPAEARAVLAQMLVAVDKAALWDDPLLDEVGAAEVLAEAGVEILGSDCAETAGATVGLTGAHAAVAETGTVVLRCGAGRERSVSLLPERHVALVRAGDLVPGLDDLARLLTGWRDDDTGLGGAVHLVSAPSCTADIEKVLVHGAHGPVALTVIAVDGC